MGVFLKITPSIIKRHSGWIYSAWFDTRQYLKYPLEIGLRTSAPRSQRTFSSAAPAASCNECTQPVRILRCGFQFTCQPCDATSCGSGSWERWNDGSWSYWNEEFRETEWYASPLVNSVKTGDSHPGLSTHAQCIIFVSLTGKGRIHLLSTLQNW